MARYGKRIAELRKKRGMNQESLAGLLGITRASLSHYETDRREPDYEILTKMADLFRVSFDDLMGRSPDDQPTDPQIHITEFLNRVELADDKIASRYELTIDGRTLTPEETKRFIAIIRSERATHSDRLGS
ncbi:helix-turn-helix transcriptional regulator [Paenibacillus sp. LHD-117]|uniref:helix-turn-helix domain-containing protein n=1 Tax=Paenibacillus sp. LHD-117 TaxID=3071412 RepID=UPI0027E119E6|nr:helix-turn-helix transcriptional regulator [Paenibacillus sp. LHD-117]MDQ6420643.1 helix-turn-helix transcriptional regulator [Paenibacillus sp. LHD-117]